MEETERCSDPQLWHACAGALVKQLPVNSIVCYFPQGHAENCREQFLGVEIKMIPPYILCKVESINYLAHQENDEVYAKIRLDPLENSYKYDQDTNLENAALDPMAVAKILTQSDVNNGGGFSMPRHWSDEMFPQLDYSMKPPVQTITARDIHGEEWKFRHIYRGTPRRHLLTTGWSCFVHRKKLVVGDSVVFVKSEDGELRIGIRRRKTDEDELRKIINGAESLVSAISLGVNGKKFEVVYYPRPNVPEFIVKASSVDASMRIQWCQGLRFKMPFESNDNTRISLCMGTVSSVKSYDHCRFPNSPWRILEVVWDEKMVDEVEKVSPWLVELVSNMPPPLNLFSNNLCWPNVNSSYNFAYNGQLPIPPPQYGTFLYQNCPNPLGIQRNIPDMNTSEDENVTKTTETVTFMLFGTKITVERPQE